MKKCPNCGAQIADDSRFCTECGKECTQGNVCPHCGASVNDGDSFCQNCGKSIIESKSESAIDEPIFNEEEKKSGFKKFLPYIIGAVIILGFIGYCSSKDSKKGSEIAAADTIAVDSMSTRDVTTADETPITKEELESILSQLVGEMDGDMALKKVNKLFTEEYKNEFNKLCENADKNGMERPRIWWPYSDSDPTNFSIDKIEQLSTKAKAVVKLSSDVYDGHFEVLLNNETGDWLIEEIITLGVENAQEFETTEDYEEDLDWLQGHWVYEQGNYKGHFIIQGNTITQYSSMNPKHYDATYRIEGNELRAKLIDGMDLVVKIDFTNHTIDYGDGNWMHKIN